MGIVENLLLSVIHMLLVAIDVLILAMLVRAARRRWPSNRWLEAVDSVAQPIVDRAFSTIDQVITGPGGTLLRQDIRAALGAVGLLLVRFVLAVVARGIASWF